MKTENEVLTAGIAMQNKFNVQVFEKSTFILVVYRCVGFGVVVWRTSEKDSSASFRFYDGFGGLCADYLKSFVLVNTFFFFQTHIKDTHPTSSSSCRTSIPLRLHE